jgi:hypothetical protein
MDSNEKNRSDFVSLITPWADSYKCAVVSFFATKNKEEPCIIIGRIVLEPSITGLKNDSYAFESKSLVAKRGLITLDKQGLLSLISGAFEGVIDIDGIVKLAPGDSGNYSTYFSPFYYGSLSDGPRLPNFAIDGVSKYQAPANYYDSRPFDWELKGAETPFDNVEELLALYGLPGISQSGSSTRLEIIAKSPAVIDSRSVITNGRVEIKCVVSDSLDLEKIRVGYKIFQQDFVERLNVSGSDFKWKKQGDVKVGSFKARVGKSSIVQAFLSYSDVFFHQWWISDPKKQLNPRHIIHQTFDEDMELLKKMILRPDGDKSQNFENVISTLLYMLGFSVSNYGRIPKLQRGPDIIAISPSGNIGVIECTVGLLNENSKLDKLVQRTNLIKEKLKASRYGSLQILPVIVTPLPRAEVSANLEAAGKYGIAVVCKEDLEQMLDQVGFPPNGDSSFEEAKRLIPESGQSNQKQKNR